MEATRIAAENTEGPLRLTVLLTSEVTGKAVFSSSLPLMDPTILTFEKIIDIDTGKPVFTGFIIAELADQNIFYVRQLINRTAHEAMRIPCFGAYVRPFQKWLAAYNLDFKKGD